MNEIFPRTFYVLREHDETGISGTGRVLEGVVFHTGQIVICWHSQYLSITIFDSWSAFDGVHLHAHPENRTRIIFQDGGTAPPP